MHNWWQQDFNPCAVYICKFVWRWIQFLSFSLQYPPHKMWQYLHTSSVIIPKLHMSTHTHPCHYPDKLCNPQWWPAWIQSQVLTVAWIWIQKIEIFQVLKMDLFHLMTVMNLSFGTWCNWFLKSVWVMVDLNQMQSFHHIHHRSLPKWSSFQQDP